ARHHVRAALRFGRSGILRAAGILLGAAPDAPGAGAEILTICCIRSTDRYRLVWRLSCGWAWSPALRYWRSRSTATTSRATSGWIRSNGGAMTSTATTYAPRSEEHTSELQSRENLVCRLLLEKKNIGARADQ